MLTFLSVAFSIYGAMHLYAFSKVWLVLPHSVGLGLVMAFGGLIMTLSPLILWQLTKQNWHCATVVSSWVVYTWMDSCSCFVAPRWYSTSAICFRHS